MIAELGLSGEVELPGFAHNPYMWLSKSALFVLSSRWEGSPNSLTEALALGIPVVSTNCRSGPEEILQGGKYGPLVPVGEFNELADAIVQTLENPLPGDMLKEAARQFSVQESAGCYLESMGIQENPARNRHGSDPGQ
jgi:glycosyltransferase involved in cell wall biosynthesis